MIDLHNYSGIAISISGGKDSQCILGVVMEEVRRQQFGGAVYAIHADTGAEWHESLPHCQMLCGHYGIPLHVAEPHAGLPERIERRCRMLADQGRKGGWPSSQCRYCTSWCKCEPIRKVMRGMWTAREGVAVLSVTGERRQESPHRAKLPEVNEDKMLTAGKRRVTCWRPILDWSLEDVWAHISKTGLPRHVAYDRGNERLSCAICVLAKEGDIRNGAVARPELAARYLRIERETGHTFRHKRSLADILKEVPHEMAKDEPRNTEGNRR